MECDCEEKKDVCDCKGCKCDKKEQSANDILATIRTLIKGHPIVADANTDYGDDDGGSGVVDTYSCVVPPVPPATCFILMENSGYVLQEDGTSKIQLEVC